MEFTSGQELRFKSNVGLNLWVDSIFPAGQLGYKESHIRVKINSYVFDVPFSTANQIFESNVVPLEPEPEVKPVDVEPKIILKKKRTARKKKSDA
jgi:hypothetical protein|tara:strand:+ start:592 stop:876 length:285 start_codon:yes stop_codon:yes gene_type:complete